MLAIATVGLESSSASLGLSLLRSGTWFLLATVAFVSALASRSDTVWKLREELALLAYGGSNWQVSMRYFLRGMTCTLLAILPSLYIEHATTGIAYSSTVLSAVLLSTVGAIFYATPSLTRMRSKRFVENYKG